MAAEPLVSGVRDWFFAAVPGEFSFSRCPACLSLLLDRRPRPDHLGEAYRGYYTHGAGEAAAADATWVQRIGRDLARGYAARAYGERPRPLDRLRSALFSLFPARRREVDAQYRYLPRQPARVLDYGCGNGAFLTRAAALGHEVAGVDFDPEAVRYARSQGLAVSQPGEREHAFAGSFDLITAAHVVEHVADPPALLRDFRGWLKPGGRLFIEVPNGRAAGLGKFGRFWRGLEAPRHFSVPSAQGLRRALGEAGFVVEHFGARAFAHHFMDREAAAAASGQEGGAALDGPHFDGPEILTCLARVA